MSENQGQFKLYNKSPFLQLVISLLIILTLGMALLTMLIAGGILVSGLDIAGLSGNFFNNAAAKNINLLRYFMISQDIALFIVPALIIRKMLLSEFQTSLNDFGVPRINAIVLVVVLTFCIFPITSFTGYLNAEMKLPDWLSGLEQWIKAKENDASGLLDQLIPAENFGVLIFNIIVIAVIPAISEELIFRGVFQRIFYGFFKSAHPAIWLTAFLFSAVHLQFYGFIPRFILGLVLGYLFFWSGNLCLPMISHFVNNAFPVIVIYVQGMDRLNSPTDIQQWHQAIYLPLSVAISLLILFYFRNEKKSRR